MRQYYLYILFTLLSLTALKANATTDNNTTSDNTQRKKVAVVLSGGGAKGTAHIGVLRVLEKAGIPVDIITGTSMGSIVGGLYSIGYNAAALDSLVTSISWKRVLSDNTGILNPNLAEREKEHTYIISRPLNRSNNRIKHSGGLIHGTNLASLFSRLTVGFHDSIDFNSLPIPFACVATDIITNTEYVFHSGKLSTAMRASMAIPGVFTPVRQDSMVLVDGGLRNNYPADVARAMGADIVIGVSVQGNPKTANDIMGTGDIISQIIDVNCLNKYEENWNATDIPIKVNVKGFSTASFTKTAIDSLIIRGEEAAMQHWDELVALRDSLGLDSDYAVNRAATAGEEPVPQSVYLNAIEFENVDSADQVFVSTKHSLNVNDSISSDQIEDIIMTLQSGLSYSNVGYSLMRNHDGYMLRITAGSKNLSTINLGVRFDTEEMVALQANLRYVLQTKTPLTLEFTGRLGKRIMAKADAVLTPVNFSKVSLSYIFRHNDINIYNNGDRAYNITYNQHTLNLMLMSIHIRNFSLDLGAKWDFYHYQDVLWGSDGNNNEIDNEHYYSYHLNMHYNSENAWFFTTRGSRFDAGYAYYTDNLVRRGDKPGFGVINAMWRTTFSLNSRLAVQPMIYGRVLIGRDIPMILQNTIGGSWFGHYVEQQMPFSGVNNIEFVENALIGCQVKAQQRIMDNNYIIASITAAQNAARFENLLDHGPDLGYQASYYYNSIFGPLGATVGYSERTSKPFIYVSLGFRF
ncbi:MAG: patatin-like phospholipase family protein [Prevotella sp.]|nr:patatin-like phospholipase family protein [Prevotella sp.]